ncbi:hypothetical protein D3C80_832020 [compost metagenome]
MWRDDLIVVEGLHVQQRFQVRILLRFEVGDPAKLIVLEYMGLRRRIGGLDELGDIDGR